MPGRSGRAIPAALFGSISAGGQTCTNVRARSTFLFSERWKFVARLAVEPVRVEPQLAAVWQLVARKITRKRKGADFSSRLAVWKFADMIISFLCGDGAWEMGNERGGCLSPPQGRAGVFEVAVDDLATTVPFAHGCRLGAGAIAKLRPLRLRKKLVRVTEDGMEHARDRSFVAARRSFCQACVLHQCDVCNGRAIRQHLFAV